jgi:pilus assembly protein CpaF
MVLMGKVGMSELAIKQQIASAVHVIIQAVRLSDGTRRISHITEVTGMQADVISTQDIFTFERKGIDLEGRVHGAFVGHQIVPECASKIKLIGKDFEPGFFNQRMDV